MGFSVKQTLFVDLQQVNRGYQQHVSIDTIDLAARSKIHEHIDNYETDV